MLTQAVLSQNTPEPTNKDLMLLKVANNLEIVTRGKTREQIIEDINAKVKELSTGLPV